jgi:hypothetical protein
MPDENPLMALARDLSQALERVHGVERGSCILGFALGHMLSRWLGDPDMSPPVIFSCINLARAGAEERRLSPDPPAGSA